MNGTAHERKRGSTPPFFIFYEKMAWKCKKCGICCKFIRFTADKIINEEEKNWFENHENCFIRDNNYIIKTKCKFLKDNMCTIQNSKPENCRMGGKENCVVSRSLWEKIGGEI